MSCDILPVDLKPKYSKRLYHDPEGSLWIVTATKLDSKLHSYNDEPALILEKIISCSCLFQIKQYDQYRPSGWVNWEYWPPPTGSIEPTRRLFIENTIMEEIKQWYDKGKFIREEKSNRVLNFVEKHLTNEVVECYDDDDVNLLPLPEFENWKIL